MFDFVNPFFSTNHTRGIQVENGIYYLVDLAYTSDHSWEVARSKILNDEIITNSEYSLDEIINYGSDYCNCIIWEILRHPRNEVNGIKYMRKICNYYMP